MCFSRRAHDLSARLAAFALIAVGAVVITPGILAETAPETAAETVVADTSEAHGVDAGHSLEHRMTMLALQIGIILFAGYFGSRLARRFNVPVILGELVAGILIGPFALGTIALPGYPDGLFRRVANSLSISPELYGFAVVASIVLLFLMGLQTDLRLFRRFAVKGSAVGLGGAILSVLVGIVVGRLMLGAGPGDPRSLFLGVVAIATSVDITGRILSERHKVASPEGVTTLSASVIEDVLGITLLAIVLGIDALETSNGDVEVWREIVGIGGRALVVWLGITTLGIVFSRRISALLKSVRSPAQIVVLSLGLPVRLRPVERSNLDWSSSPGRSLRGHRGHSSVSSSSSASGCSPLSITSRFVKSTPNCPAIAALDGSSSAGRIESASARRPAEIAWYAST
jgi:hypothetical protein